MRQNSDPWLRFYVRTLNNPKVQRLPGSIFKGWVNLLCLAKETDGVLPTVDDISFRLRLSKSKAESLLSTLKTSGLIDGDRMHDWDDFQYSSDSSTERVKRHRERNMERSSNVSSNVSETVQSRVDKIREDKTRVEPPLPPRGNLFTLIFYRFLELLSQRPKGREAGGPKSVEEAQAVYRSLQNNHQGDHSPIGERPFQGRQRKGLRAPALHLDQPGALG